MNNKHLSKFLSFVLRHQPQTLGIRLDSEGWTSVSVLLEKMQEQGMPVDLARLQQVVAQNDKQRFALNADASKIRANQGHSVPVSLGLPPQAPPDVLYHGTATSSLSAILKEGLKPGRRQHVHLSVSIDTAIQVGSRHGKPAVLLVKSQEMTQKGYLFYLSANGVWLTDAVPAAFLQLIEAHQ